MATLRGRVTNTGIGNNVYGAGGTTDGTGTVTVQLLAPDTPAAPGAAYTAASHTVPVPIAALIQHEISLGDIVEVSVTRVG